MQKTYRLAVLNSHPIQYFAPMYSRLAQEKYLDLTVFYCSTQGVEAYIDQGFGTTVKWDTDLLSGYHHVFLPNLRRPGPVGGFLSLLNPSIVQELRRGQFDALWVHGHNYATYLIAIAAARVLGIPLLMRSETHLLLRRSALKQTMRYPIMRLFYRQCAMCLAIGSRNADFYRYHGVSNERIALVPYTVDNDYFITRIEAYRHERASTRALLSISGMSPLILYASKLTERKHPMHLLKAYHRLRQQGIEVALAFVGSGEESDTLKAYVTEHNLKDVCFVGFANQSELPKYYAAADVFVLPAENEPWGLVINEVMCGQLPVVVADEVGAVPDLVHDGENGFVFKAGDIDSLANCLATLCVDSALRQRMGEASRRIIQNWSYNEATQGVMRALRTVTA